MNAYARAETTCVSYMFISGTLLWQVVFIMKRSYAVIQGGVVENSEPAASDFEGRGPWSFGCFEFRIGVEGFGPSPSVRFGETTNPKS